MKQRILLIVAVMLIAAPAFARVNIDVTQGTGDNVNKLTVTYNCTAGEAVRAFALNFQMTSAMSFFDINDFNRGESNRPGGGYGIFPGQFRNNIDPANPNWYAQYYYPVAPPNDVDSNGTGIGEKKMIVELGTLYKDANAPGTSGTLFTVRVDGNSLTIDTLTVTANSLRGGIVLENGNTATDINVPFTKTITLVTALPAPASITYPATHTTGRYMVSWPSVVGATGYIVQQQLNGGGWSTVYTGAGLTFLADATAGSNVFQVCATDATRQSVWTTGTASVVTYCYGSGVTAYAQWLLNGRPTGWCTFPRQCHGDADGKQQGKSPNIYWVSTNDLAVLKAAWNKSPAQIYVAPDMNGDADFDRKVQGKSPNIYSVSTNDLAILKANWNGNPAADCLH